MKIELTPAEAIEIIITLSAKRDDLEKDIEYWMANGLMTCATTDEKRMELIETILGKMYPV